jgi:hypothetical protein
MDTAAAEWNPTLDVVTPDPEATRVYAEGRRLFEDLYRAVAPLYPRLRTS